MDSLERLHDAQAALMVEAGLKVPRIRSAAEILDALMAAPVAPDDYTLQEQTRLLAEAGFPTTVEEEIALAIKRAENPDLEEAIEAIPTPAKAAKIAVHATFDPVAVTLQEGDQERVIPYVGQAARLLTDRKVLASARLMVSYAVLSAPGRLFRHTDLQELSPAIGGNWHNTHEVLRTWWKTRLLVNGHALIIPGEIRGKGVRANPKLSITISTTKTPSGKKMAR